MQRKYDQLIQMDTWELVELPKERSLVGCKWVYRLKRDSEGNIVKYKARLVAQGFSQKPSIDYTETYAPVMRTDLLRMLTAITTELDLEMHAMDVVGAYLNGKLKVDVYMRQPIGFDDGSDRVCKLILVLYGLKQAGREWNLVIDGYMRECGFSALKSNPCVYCRINDGFPTYVGLHVDNFLILAKGNALVMRIKEELATQFKMTDLGPVKQIVGFEVIRNCDQRTLML
jgi:hypothetical protein